MPPARRAPDHVGDPARDGRPDGRDGGDRQHPVPRPPPWQTRPTPISRHRAPCIDPAAPLGRRAARRTDSRSGGRDGPGPGGDVKQMIIIWRGRGLLAVAVLAAPLAVCGAHAEMPRAWYP